MSIFDFLKPKKNTASVAKDRLRIIIAQPESGFSTTLLSLVREGLRRSLFPRNPNALTSSKAMHNKELDQSGVGMRIA